MGFFQKMYHTVRLGLQAIALAFHLVLGLVAALSAMRILNENLKTRLISAWSKILLFILRIKVFSDYQNHASHAIVVANHVSWIDAFVIGSLNGSRFVVRSDVAQWPVLGTLVKSTSALFLDRSSSKSARSTLHRLNQKIMSGIPFCIFPEGTTSSGEDVLPFKSPLLQCACEEKISAHPISLRYKTRSGLRCDRTPYVGDTTFMQSFVAILSSPESIFVHVKSLEVHENYECRKKLASSLEDTIRASLQFGS